jgi:hypothetical protein
VKRGAKHDGEKQDGDGIPDADGFPDGDRTAPLFPIVGFSDWNNPRVRQLGKQFAAEAYTLAGELNSHGADPMRLLLPREEQADNLPWDICVPRELLDVVTAVLLSLPRPGERRGRRSRWTIHGVEVLIDSGMSLRKAAKLEALRTGASATTIERTARAWRARKQKG